MNKKLIISISAAVAAVAVANAQPIPLTPANFGQILPLGGNSYEITADLSLADNGEDGYILEGTTYVNSGVILELAAGVVVRGQPSQAGTGNADDLVPGSLCVSRGGELIADGQQLDPVIFTTAADVNRERWALGDAFLDATPSTSPLPPFDGAIANSNLWGAVTLLGYAPTNRGVADTGIAGEAFIEGFALQNFRTTYGGFLPNDCSGSLNYVSIRHTGLTIVDGDEQQGLTLGGVGAGTVLQNIDIYCSGDDGVEIFGGTANICNTMISYVDDDGFDLDQGWTGNAQNIFILASNIANTPNEVQTASVAEWDGEDGLSNGGVDASGVLTVTGQPFTAPTMYNFTFFADGVSGTAVTIDSGFGGNLFNSIFMGLGNGAIRIDDEGAGNPAAAGFGFAGVGQRTEQGHFNVASNTFVAPGVASIADLGFTDAPNAINGFINLADRILANDAAFPGCVDNIVELANPNPFFFGFGGALGGIFNDQTIANGVNPVPLAGANLNVVSVKGPFFKASSVRGAFPQAGTELLFTSGWSALNLRGILVDAGNTANVVNP